MTDQTREDARMLVGGHATRTLAPEERRALYAAALEDDQLFAELVDEQPLYDLLEDRDLRLDLAADLKETPRGRVLAWRLPQWQIAVPLAAAATLVIAAGVVLLQPPSTPGGGADSTLADDTARPVDLEPAELTPEQPGPERQLAVLDLPALIATADAVPGGSELQIESGDSGFRASTSSKSVGDSPAPSSGLAITIAPVEGGDVLLVGIADDGTAVQLYPERVRAAESLPPGGQVRVTPRNLDGRRLVSVRLLVLPPGVDIADDDAVRDAFANGAVTVLERRLSR